MSFKPSVTTNYKTELCLVLPKLGEISNANCNTLLQKHGIFWLNSGKINQRVNSDS